MASLNAKLRQVDLRTERAFIYKELVQLEVHRAHTRFNEQLTSPATLVALAGAGMFVGTLSKPDRGRLRDLQSRLESIEDNLRNADPAASSSDSNAHNSADLRSLIVSAVTSFLTRTVISYFAMDDVDTTRATDKNR
jgi:hypothetical protein